jgi:iron complex outermembrane recepter protein
MRFHVFLVPAFAATLAATPASAQSPETSDAAPLPALVVEGAKAKKAKAAKVAKPAPKAKQVAAPAKAPPAPVDAPQDSPPAPSGLQAATGPVEGFAATSSATGSKTATPLIETPQSVSVVGREEMDQRGADTLQEALAYTPGVTTFASPRSRFLDEFFLRGFDTGNGDLGQLRDGMKLQANVYDGGQEPYGIERVDVLKGASSILYGQLGPGGVINSISKRPSFVPKGEINLTGGSFGNQQISADVSGPAGRNFAYRLTALGRDSDTWVDHINDDRRYIAPAFTWKPSDATTFTLLSYYQETRSKLSAPVDYLGSVVDAPGVGKIPRDRFIGEPGFDRFNINSGAIGYLFEHDFNSAVTLRHNARYYEAKGNWDYLTFLRFNPANPAGPTMVRGVSSRDEHSTNFTTDTSVELKFGSGPILHTAIAGIEYARSGYYTVRFRSGGNPLGGELSVFDPDYGAVNVVVPTRDTGFDRTIDQVGIYFQDQIKLYDRFVLLAGGRQDWARSDLQAHTTGAPVQTQDDAAFTWRLGGVYLGPFGFSPFASYSESFSPVLGASFGVEQLDPTSGEQYEAGLRWQSPDKKTLVSAAAFTIDQANVLTFAPDFSFRQSGLVRSEGFEVEAKTQSGPLSLLASYAYTDTRTIEDDDPDLVGKRRSLIPLHQVSFWAAYDFTSLGIRGLTLGAGARYVGRTNLPEADLEVPSYVLVDAMASLDLGKVNGAWNGYHAQFNAKNLFDEDSVSCSLAVQGCDYGQPATFTGTVSYRW